MHLFPQKIAGNYKLFSLTMNVKYKHMLLPPGFVKLVNYNLVQNDNAFVRLVHFIKFPDNSNSLFTDK